jgi:site-specific DNA-methyltransferase (cytosine-N4-specific)
MLGLLPRREHRKREQQMLGNRETTEFQRKRSLAYFEATRTCLPNAVVSLIDRIHRLNSNGDVGFRRRNLSALLARYFIEMRQVLQGCQAALRPGGTAFFVVGNNSTIAGGERVNIATAALLAEIADSVGFRVEQSISMEMLTSRDIFKMNAMQSEEILQFKKL